HGKGPQDFHSTGTEHTPGVCATTAGNAWRDSITATGRALWQQKLISSSRSKPGGQKMCCKFSNGFPGLNKPIPALGGRILFFSLPLRMNEPSRMWSSQRFTKSKGLRKQTHTSSPIPRTRSLTAYGRRVVTRE